jgi:hypothetical protein
LKPGGHTLRFNQIDVGDCQAASAWNAKGESLGVHFADATGADDAYVQ